MPGKILSLGLVIFLLGAAAFVNVFGALGPELGFDALWYHLTIPKLYLTAGEIFHIPGGLLYYSEMPRLSEILYLPLIKYISFLGPHLLSWLSGIGAAIITYKLARKLGLSSFFSLLSSLFFYVTPLVGWESGSAYIDLNRTFFEVLALYLAIDKKYLLAGLATGLTVSTKTLALGSVPILSLIVLLQSRNIRSCILYLASCVLVSVPWFVLAYLYTGYPLYPIGAGILPASHTIVYQLLHPWSILVDFWKVSLFPDDPITPLYLISLPFLIFSLPKIPAKARPVVLYAFLGLLAWFYTPQLGGGRYLLPYLPALAVSAAVVFSLEKDKLLKFTFVSATIIIALVNCLYRIGANARLIPYLLGKQTGTAYLCQNLDFKTGVFADCDGWFAKNIRPGDLVYIAGVHNLFYINFPFVHETWYRGEDFNYILTQNENLEQIKDNGQGIIVKKIENEKWEVVYQNKLTNIKVYFVSEEPRS